MVKPMFCEYSALHYQNKQMVCIRNFAGLTLIREACK